MTEVIYYLSVLAGDFRRETLEPMSSSTLGQVSLIRVFGFFYLGKVVLMVPVPLLVRVAFLSGLQWELSEAYMYSACYSSQ